MDTLPRTLLLVWSMVACGGPDDPTPPVTTADTSATAPSCALELTAGCIDVRGTSVVDVTGASPGATVELVVVPSGASGCAPQEGTVVAQATADDEGAARLQLSGDPSWEDGVLVQARTGEGWSAATPLDTGWGITPGSHTVDEGAGLFLGVVPNGLAGDKVAGGDLDGDGLAELVIGAKQAGPGGTVYVVDAPAGGDLELARADGILRGPPGSFAGGSVAVSDDLTGDGLPDLLVGGKLAGSDDRGSVWIVSGPATTDQALDDSYAQLVGASAGDLAGGNVVGIGDLDGDGAADLAVGANAAGTTGAAFVVRGPIPAGSASLADADVVITGQGAGDRLPSSLSHVGDLDGDGRDDLVLCAGDAEAGAGGCYVLPWTGPGAVSTSAAARTWTGTDGSHMGELAGVGDVTGDGLPDLLFGGAEADGGAGAAWLVPGNAASGPVASVALGSFAGSPGAHAGFSVAGAGDVDGDGVRDLLVGAEDEGPGRAYLILGTDVSGQHDLVDVFASWEGERPGDQLGHEVVGLGDVDGDGYDDLLFGAHYAATGAGDRAGSALLVWGGPGW